MMHDLGFDDRAESSHISPSKPLFGFIPIQHESMLIRSTDSMMLLPPPNSHWAKTLQQYLHGYSSLAINLSERTGHKTI